MKQGTVYPLSLLREKINIPQKEILRYMGCKEETPSASELIHEFLPRVHNSLLPKGSFARLPVEIKDNVVKISDLCVTSYDLSKNLSECSEVIVFALSLGTDVDRLINKYSIIRPSASLCINSIGVAAIEEYADMFCKEISDKLSAENLYTRPRFSCGYGDFSIEYQADILKLVNASRLCGINLTNSYLMTPSKSVTAIVGISNINSNCTSHKCGDCAKTDCKYRR